MFWAWASVEVLRLTGIRIEELTELTHPSLVQYRVPATGELVPLLHIAPSKTDTERLLVVPPELADVLSAIICRVRDDTGAIPLVAAYDYHERVFNPPLPILFQRRIGTENRAINAPAIRHLLDDALAATGLTGTDGQPLRFVPHDFRRIFITDAVMNGMPPHIAQLVVGHRDLNTTMGYKAIYPEESINATARSSPATVTCVLPQSTAPRPMRSGKNSSATSNAASSLSASVAAPTEPLVSTSTAASDAHCFGSTRPNSHDSWSSATT